MSDTKRRTYFTPDAANAANQQSWSPAQHHRESTAITPLTDVAPEIDRDPKEPTPPPVTS